MAVRHLMPKVLEIDVTTAGVSVGQTFLTVPNPEGRDILLAGYAVHAQAFSSEGADAWLIMKVGNNYATPAMATYVQGGSTTALRVHRFHDGAVAAQLWSATESLGFFLDDNLAAAPDFVGKVYVEYWATARTTGSLCSIS